MAGVKVVDARNNYSQSGSTFLWLEDNAMEYDLTP
jgi:hypothetical protein